MNRKRLGKSTIWVTDLCMGTMTMGSKNSEQESFEILDRCWEAGINFFDTADISLDEKTLARIDEISQAFPYPLG